MIKEKYPVCQFDTRHICREVVQVEVVVKPYLQFMHTTAGEQSA